MKQICYSEIAQSKQSHFQPFCPGARKHPEYGTDAGVDLFSFPYNRWLIVFIQLWNHSDCDLLHNSSNRESKQSRLNLCVQGLVSTQRLMQMLVCVQGLVSVQSPDQMLVLSFSHVPIISSSSFLFNYGIELLTLIVICSIIQL